jgi:hypothetical protein
VIRGRIFNPFFSPLKGKAEIYEFLHSESTGNPPLVSIRKQTILKEGINREKT